MTQISRDMTYRSMLDTDAVVAMALVAATTPTEHATLALAGPLFLMGLGNTGLPPSRLQWVMTSSLLVQDAP